MRFRWSWLQPLWSSWASGNGLLAVLNSTTAAKPVRLQAETLEPLLVNFENEDQQTLNNYRVEQQTFDGMLGSRPSTLQQEDYFIASVKESAGCLDTCKSAQKGFFWLNGDYVLTLNVKYDAHKERTQSFSFAVSAEEESRLKGNLEHIVFQNTCPLHFSDCAYQAVFKDIDDI